MSDKSAIPAPRNDEELALLSLWYFGLSLRLKELRAWSGGASYEVAELYSMYHGDGYAYNGYSCDGYDSSRDFWRAVIGELTCGGIASHSYGQAKVVGHRNAARLEQWIKLRKLQRISTPRKLFERLALKQGEGERTRIRDMRRVTGGRVDAAQALSNSEKKAQP